MDGEQHGPRPDGGAYDADDGVPTGPPGAPGAPGPPGAPGAPGRRIPPVPAGATGWRAAAERALYGAGTGFYLREAPAAHFRTSVHASALFATAVAELLGRVDEALDRPHRLALVDVGAGRGELLTGVLAALPAERAERLWPVAVERAARPAGLDPRVSWRDRPPERVTGLVFANEWLDNVPLEVAETGPDGVPRYVLVTPAGEEVTGGPVTGRDAAWLRRWWPGCEEPGARAEIGTTRDAAWSDAVRGLERGLAVAVDYAHSRDGRPPLGTLTGYRGGRQVPPVPDGSCDLTAHVALDACAAAVPAGDDTGVDVRPARLLTQRAALRQLGVCGDRPPRALAGRDPVGYLRALARAGEAAELTAPAGLGGFGWLVQPVGVPCPLE